MQLNITTDYAIRIVVYLGMTGGFAASRDISGSMGIPYGYVLKIVRKLAAAGIVTTSTGIYGGISLNKKPGDISLLDIIQTMESTAKINRYLEKDKYCSRFATETCPVRQFYCVLQDELESKLSSITVAALLQQKKGDVS
ncbi:RrF2 family transcriptional regulator [Massilicoli timonensis]|uniref:RrF2 family transcriptional regulator n=1 Tax=Massilicoli timonensis TaxID=2015901 RepID=UPI000C827E0B|nr:Rrf2 family transcriptional regulator [Massilicoli timonensis]